MIKVEKYGFEHAIRNLKAKGYTARASGYEAFVSEKGKTVRIGSFKTKEDAKESVYAYRAERFIDRCKTLGLDPYDGVEYCKNYIVFPCGKVLNLHGIEITGAIDKCGYRHIIVNGKNENVHRIVAKVFIKNPNNYEQVNHVDGDKLNNDVDNLEWCTRSENLKHAYRVGLERKRNGEEHHSHKLTNEIVMYIRKNAIKGSREFGFNALARKFGVDKSTVSAIYYGESWRHLL